MGAARKTGNLKLKLILEKDPGVNYAKIFKKDTKHQRSSVNVKETKKNLIIEVEAKDATALRASANSLIRNLQVIESTKYLGK